MQQAPTAMSGPERGEAAREHAAYRRGSLRYRSGDRRGFDGLDARGREVVIELRGDDRTRLAEAERLIGIAHHALAPVRDARADGHGWFVVMERWAGPSLELLLRAEPLPPADVVALLHPIASALDVLHEAGVTHRAFCAENVVISDPSAPRLWIVGNPSVPAAGGSADGAATLALQAPEGLDYVPPDLLEGAARPDVYALAVLAFRLLAGELPFRRYATLTQTLVERQEQPAARLAEIARRPVHRSLEDWARTALAGEERLRPVAASALIAELATAAGEPIGDHMDACGRLLGRAEPRSARPTVMGAQAMRATRRDPAAPPSDTSEAPIVVDVEEAWVDSIPPPALEAMPPPRVSQRDLATPMLDMPASSPAPRARRRAAAWIWIGWILLSVVALLAVVASASAR